MRKTLITSIVATLLAMSAVAIASNAPAVPAAAAAAPAGPGAPAPTNNTAYEKAITAYLNNVVDKARKKQPPTSVAPQRQHRSYPMSPGYPELGSMGQGQGRSRDLLPRVERITIGLVARAVIETPDGGWLRVSPGVRTPSGEVTAIRASGVWFRIRGTHRSVLLADIAGDGSTTVKVSQGLNPMQPAPTNVPMPPNFQSAPQQ